MLPNFVFFLCTIVCNIGNKCTIDGVTYNTKQEAYKKLGRRYVDRYLTH